MFRWYGIAGILMVVFAEMNFIFRIQPFAQWYFPIIWFGYIFAIDAVVYKLKGKSLISDSPGRFMIMLALSSLVWWMFEYIGFVLHNWYYTGLEGFGSRFWVFVFGTLSFSTVIPAVFETAMLLKTIHVFDSIALEHRYRISKKTLNTMMVSGILTFALPVLFPSLFYPLIWISFFLIMDPINYMHGRPSIISYLRDRNLAVPLSIFVGATVCGFLWEFWNYWAIPKWHYSLPFVNFFKIFEMPILGYIGYGPFGLELYAMYQFAMGLLYHRGIYIFKY